VRPGADGFERFFERIVDLMVESVGFVELVVGARGALGDYDGDERLAGLVDAPLRRAQAVGRIASTVTVGDVALALRMIYGVAASARDADQRRADVQRAYASITFPWRR